MKAKIFFQPNLRSLKIQLTIRKIWQNAQKKKVDPDWKRPLCT